MFFCQQDAREVSFNNLAKTSNLLLFEQAEKYGIYEVVVQQYLIIRIREVGQLLKQQTVSMFLVLLVKEYQVGDIPFLRIA